MHKQEMGELLRLLHAARRSGVLGQIMDTMEVGEQPAGMSERLGNLRVARPLTTRPGM